MANVFGLNIPDEWIEAGQKAGSAALPAGYLQKLADDTGGGGLLGHTKYSDGRIMEHVDKQTGGFKLGYDQLYEAQPDGTYKYVGYKGQGFGGSNPTSGANVSSNAAAGGINRDAARIPGYDSFQSQLAAGAKGAAYRSAPQMQAATIDPTQQGQFRGMQMSLAQQLLAQSQGQGPSLAQMQLQQASDRNFSQALAMAQSTRGAGAAGAVRQLANQRASIGQQLAADSGMLRLQEQQQAQGLLGQVAGTARNTDVGLATSQAGLHQDAAGRNLGATMQQRELNDRAVQFYLAQGMTLAQAQQQAALEMERLIANNAIGQADIGLKRNDQNMQLYGAVAKGAGDTIATAAKAFSDERLKTDIKPAGKKLYELLDSAEAHEYRYKDPKHGSPRISSMAQELEKSELGRQMVEETPEGKRVDYGKGLGTMLASQAELHRRLKALESKPDSKPLPKLASKRG
jgi:hypothetical protein